MKKFMATMMCGIILMVSDLSVEAKQVTGEDCIGDVVSVMDDDRVMTNVEVDGTGHVIIIDATFKERDVITGRERTYTITSASFGGETNVGVSSNVIGVHKYIYSYKVKAYVDDNEVMVHDFTYYGTMDTKILK